MIGFGQSSMARQSRWVFRSMISEGDASIDSLRSAPAANAFSSPVRTMARTSLSPANAPNASADQADPATTVLGHNSLPVPLRFVVHVGSLPIVRKDADDAIPEVTAQGAGFGRAASD